MAVPEQTPYIEHTGNGATTDFALKFQCESKDHLIVLIDDIEPPIETWSLGGGNVVFTTAPAAGKKIALQRNTPFSRTTDYQSYNNSFRPPAVNRDFDWIWLKLQELGVADWILGARIDALKNYVDRKDDELKAYLMEEIRKQGVALDQLDEYYNYLMQRLAQIAVDKGWDASFVVYHGISQKKINDGLESIAELLAIQKPFDGMRVFLKSHSHGNGVGYLGEATPYKGGNWFIYRYSRSTENDGVFIFNGWERFLESNTYTPYMSGCMCDGITDDTLNFDKLMYALEVNNMKGRVFIEDDMFFNNQCPLTGKLRYGMNFGDGLPVIRLVDNVDIEIKSTLKFGSFYNDKAIAVFNAKYNSDANDWLGNKHYNINIYGGGTLDFSQAGNMQTAYRKRICFSLANCTNSSVHNLTVKKGDFMNTIVTNYRGNGVDIHHMTFIDQIDDSSVSHDHSTMYLISENCHVYANQFISSGVKSRLNACAVELHGNNQHMYGNKTILGYRNAVFVAAYKLGHEGVDDLYRGDISIKNNTADCLSFFKLWTDSVLPMGIIECENNIQKVPNFVTRQEVLDAGVDVSLWDNLPQVAHFFGTETDQNATQFPDSPNAYIKVHNNDYVGGVSGFDQDFFMYTPLIVRDGLDMQFNKIKARQLFVLDDFRDNGQQMIMRRFKFLNNDVSWSAIYDRLAISTASIAFQNSEIDLNVDFTLSTTLTTDHFFWVDVDAASTFNNKFSFKLDRTNQFNKSVGGSLTTQNVAFYSYNKLIYTARIDIQTYSEAGQKSVYLFSNDSRIVNGVSTVELKMLTASGAIPFIYPSTMSKDVRTGSLDRQVAALAYNTEGTPLPTGIYGYAVIST
ncbi:hypothetical protein [Acinetobacter lwoffii]|uniref:hypothetical protein n=1 Tax=Acinetobacter lwoffii TaxID=28090 RepID=UPI0030088FFA